HVPCPQGRFPCRESGRRVLRLVVERLGPEPRETIRIRRVEHNLNLRSHWIPDRRRTGCYLDKQPPTEGTVSTEVPEAFLRGGDPFRRELVLHHPREAAELVDASGPESRVVVVEEHEGALDRVRGPVELLVPVPHLGGLVFLRLLELGDLA